MSASPSLPVTPVLIASNVNTILNCGSYSKQHKCFAFGASNLIHLYSPSLFKTFLTLKHHTSRINSVKWIDNEINPNDLIELISVGSDGNIIHWLNSSQDKNPFEITAWKHEHIYSSSDKDKNVSINLLDVLYLNQIEKYFVTFTSNGVLDLFYFDIDLNEFKLFASLNYSRKLQDALCLTVLNDNYLLLLTGGYDTKIYVHTVMRIKKMNQMLQLQNSNIVPIECKVALIGHDNDIRGISAISPQTHSDVNNVIICSCSQDSYIRIWNVSKLKENELTVMADKVNINKTNSIYDEYKSKTSYVINVDNSTKDTNENEYYNITLDSVLSGHEDAVSSVQWCKLADSSPSTYVILSSSFDFTVAIWKYDNKHNIWNKEHTLGEMLGNSHAFFYATFLDSSNEILAYAYNGALYLWKMNNNGEYKNNTITHGHFGSVNDIDWDPSGNILFSCSSDETTRAYGLWKSNNTWHELNRPQIHGYEINSICCFKQNNQKDNMNYICRLISGADEKLIRIFTPPFNIVTFSQQLSNLTLQFKPDNTNEYYEKKYSNVEGSKQALGLMNKEVITNDNATTNDKDEGGFGSFDPDSVLTNKTEQCYISKYDYSHPPNEDFLSNNTLWPEESKLYGHGSEVYAVALSHDNMFIASSQKAQNDKNASLYLWNSTTNKLIDKIKGHALTIVQIEFSPSDNFILTSSRDRGWCVFKKAESKTTYEHMQYVKNAHGRIIWSCSWEVNERYFITGSRDKTISIWVNKDNVQFSKCATLSFDVAVTAVEFVKMVNKEKSNCHWVFVGFENGDICLCVFDSNANTIENKYTFNQYMSHGKAVKRIKSVVIKGDNNEVSSSLRVGTCSEDHSVRIFTIDIKQMNNYIHI